LERENLLAAHAFCIDDLRAELGLRLVGALQLYWLSRGLGELGYRLTIEGLCRNGAPESGAARCRALFAAGQIGYFTGRYQEAKAHLEQSIPLALEMDDQASAAGALVLLGHACHALGQSSQARFHFEEGLTLARSSGDQAKLHAAHNALAELYRGRGLLDEAEPLYEESLILQRERGERANIVISLYNLAAVTIGRGAPHRALTLVREGIGIAQELDSTYLGELMLDMCAALAAALGEPKRTAVFYGAAQAQLEAIGLRRDPADDSFLTPLIAQARESIGDIVFASTEAEGRALGYDGAIRLARTWLADVPDTPGRPSPLAPLGKTQG
jgi:tetratricopeptide (TPR) repeat protein